MFTYFALVMATQANAGVDLSSILSSRFAAFCIESSDYSAVEAKVKQSTELTEIASPLGITDSMFRAWAFRPTEPVLIKLVNDGHERSCRITGYGQGSFDGSKIANQIASRVGIAILPLPTKPGSWEAVTPAGDQIAVRAWKNSDGYSSVELIFRRVGG